MLFCWLIMPDFLAYQTYPNPALAQDVLALLDAHRIPYRTHHAPARFSAVLGTTTAEQFVLSLPPADFTRVRQLEEAQAGDTLAQLPVDYYLFQFSNAELWDLLAQPAAWSSHDVALAGRLLRERGEPVAEATLRDLRQQHTAALATPDPPPTGWLLAGYAFALLGGLLGIGIGWGLWHYRKTLPDGRQVPGYDAATRAHGRQILVLGIGSLLGWLALGWFRG